MYDAGMNGQQDQLGVYAVASCDSLFKALLGAFSGGKGVAGHELIVAKNAIA